MHEHGGRGGPARPPRRRWRPWLAVLVGALALALGVAACSGGDKPSGVASLGGALEGDDQLFASEDTVEAEWQVVEPVLGDATPVYEDEPGTWGPEEADQLVGDGGWSNPAGRERRPR